MSKIIIDGKLVEDQWDVIESTDLKISDLPKGDLLLPLHLWNLYGNELRSKGRKVALWLRSDELPEDIEGDINGIPVIAVQFPLFTDGRGFSIGRLLRERYDFQNELRAFGSPIRDQLTYLCRCGFNAFQLAEHYDPEEALKSLSDFTEYYQAAVDEPEPKFRRYGS